MNHSQLTQILCETEERIQMLMVAILSIVQYETLQRVPELGQQNHLLYQVDLKLTDRYIDLVMDGI